MNLSKLSASSFKSHCHCPAQFFIQQNLKYNFPGGKAADRGTIAHRVLEILAEQKLARQSRDIYFATAETGEIGACEDISIPELTRDVFEYQTTHIMPHHEWDESDFKECSKYVNVALEHGDGRFDPRNRKIISTEQYIKIAPDENWALLPNNKKLYITGFIDLVTDEGDNAIEIIDWKGLPVETPILTENGWIKMGDIKIGETVFDHHGQKTKVIGKSKPSYKPCFKIEFDDKSTVTCDDEHLWKMADGTTKPIKKLEVGDKIPITKPINFNKQNLPIDPYVLGVWLGDGRNKNGEICITEDFILNEIKNRGYKTGDNIGSKKSPSYTILGLMTDLKKLNLLNNKHIPKQYLIASIEQRTDLLRGLMDSDGNVNKKRKQAVFTNCNKNLSLDVKELLLSLGQRPNLSEITRNTNFKSNVSVFPIAFRPIDINPFLLPRKNDQIDKNWGPGKSNVRRILKIEKFPFTLKTQCIKVDSIHHTYICDNDYIVTHNTGRQVDFHTGKELNEDTLRDDIQLKMYHYAATKIYGEDKTFLVTIFFLKTKCPITIHFTASDLDNTKTRIREKMDEILCDNFPRRNMSWKCKKFCDYGKNTFAGTNVAPLMQMYENGLAKQGEVMTICDQVNFEIGRHGLEWVEENMAK